MKKRNTKWLTDELGVFGRILWGIASLGASEVTAYLISGEKRK